MTKPALATLIATVFAAACANIPGGTIKPDGGDEGSYSRHVAEARQQYDAAPRTLERIQAAAVSFAGALKIKADDYDVLWHAARTCAWLGEFMESREERRPIVKDGIAYTNTALQLRPEGVEARFYHGVLAGLLGDVDHDYGLDAAKTVEADMKALIALDANIAHAGPWRVLGALYLRAPGPPTSVGSMRNARKMLAMAIEKATAWPENHLYMAELELGNDQLGNPQSARERLETHLLGASAPPDHEFEFAAWQAKARALLSEKK